MQGLHTALSGSEAFVKFIGQPRTGKSGVCEKLTQFMRLKGYRVIYFDYPIESPDMLRSMLAKELDIPDTFNVLRNLEDALVTEDGKPLVIIFDDAHLLSGITLIEIYRLAGVQVAQKRVINIVLCGEPELERRLSSKKQFTSLLQQVSHNFLLEPMNAATASHFLSAFLEKMKLPGLQLQPAALSQFYKSCKGFPGPAYSLCQLILAIRQGSHELSPITKEELLLAIRSADSEQPVSSSLLRQGKRGMLFAPVAAVVVIASLALLARQLNPPESQNEVEQVAVIATEGEEELVPAASPFAMDELLLAESDSQTSANSPAQVEALNVTAQLAVSSSEPQVDEPAAEEAAVEEEMTISDSTLALVTAQERGISDETLIEPLFEPMPLEKNSSAVKNNEEAMLSVVDESTASDEPVQLANVTLTRPMLALDEIEIAPEIAPEMPRVEPALSPVEDAVKIAPDAVSLTSAPSESSPAAPELVALSPQQMVQSWLDAWQGQDLENYFASYAEDFDPRYHRSKSAWRSNRERVIGNASQITLELSGFTMISEDADNIEVHFWLAYSSPSYRDDTRKKLVLKKLPAGDQGVVRLVILEEINLEVRV